MTESWFYHIAPSGKLVRVATVAAALAACRDGGFVWLHYCQPTKEELDALVDPLGLHPLSIEDCLDDNQVPKIEDFPRNTLLLFNAFAYCGTRLSIGESDLFIGEEFLVTVRRKHHRGMLLAGRTQVPPLVLTITPARCLLANYVGAHALKTSRGEQKWRIRRASARAFRERTWSCPSARLTGFAGRTSASPLDGFPSPPSLVISSRS